MITKSSSNDSTLIIGMLGVAFVVLKLVGVIDWSWWWVTLPFWGGIALVLGAGVLVFCFIFLRETFKAWRANK